MQKAQKLPQAITLRKSREQIFLVPADNLQKIIQEKKMKDIPQIAKELLVIIIPPNVKVDT